MSDGPGDPTSRSAPIGVFQAPREPDPIHDGVAMPELPGAPWRARHAVRGSLASVVVFGATGAIVATAALAPVFVLHAALFAGSTGAGVVRSLRTPVERALSSAQEAIAGDLVDHAEVRAAFAAARAVDERQHSKAVVLGARCALARGDVSEALRRFGVVMRRKTPQQPWLECATWMALGYMWLDDAAAAEGWIERLRARRETSRPLSPGVEIAQGIALVRQRRFADGGRLLDDAWQDIASGATPALRNLAGMARAVAWDARGLHGVDEIVRRALPLAPEAAGLLRAWPDAEALLSRATG